MNIHTWLTRGAPLLVVLALILLQAGRSAAAPPGDPQAPAAAKPITTKADLAADAALDRPITLNEVALDKIQHMADAVPDLLAEVTAVTQRPVIVLAQASLAGEKIARLSGKPAREALQAVAEAAGASWERYGDFYLLGTPVLQRHDVRPRRMDKNYPELARKTTQEYSGLLTDVVRMMGVTNKTITVVCVNRGFQGPGPTLPAVIAARGRTIDEIMCALAALTGNPWEHYHGMHVLSFSGEPLTEKDHQNLDRLAQSYAWKQSLTPNQLEQLRSENGLPVSELPPGQLRQLMVNLRPMLELHQANLPDVVLRFITKDKYSNVPGNDIYVYQVTAGKWNTIGRVPYP